MRRLAFTATGATRKPLLRETDWLAMTFAIFALGLGAVAWEWCHAHTAVPHPAGDPADDRHHSTGAPAATTPERNE